MKPIYSIFLLSSIILLSACTTTPQRPLSGIIIDNQGVNMSTYYQDLQQCRNYTAQVNVSGQVTEKTISGAVIGAAAGAITGDSNTAKRAAGAGGLLGAVKGFGQAGREKQRVIKNCLLGRGYRVLN